MNDIIVTTTNFIENTSISKYFGIVSANIVLGTNMFSDIAASFSDFFGGYSESYQNKLQLIYKEATKELTQKANRLGANCILGLKIDFDELSGKGKSMFMISAIGTAVKIDFNKSVAKDISETIPYELIEQEFKKKKLIHKVEDKGQINQDEWNFLLQNPFPEIAEMLLVRYIDVFLQNKSDDTLSLFERLMITNFPRYIISVDHNTSISVLYKHINRLPEKIINILVDGRLFDSAEIINLINNNELSIAIKLLSCPKDIYTKDDIALLNSIVQILDNLPEQGKIEYLKGGLLSKAGDKYICPNGHKNSINDKFCENCGKNIHGLDEKDLEDINNFKIKLDILSDFMA